MYKYLVEFLGTAFFISSIAFTSNPLYVVSSLAIAMALGGKISGGHFNPVVSLWAWLSSKLSTSDLGMYLLSQTLGASIIWLVGELSS